LRLASIDEVNRRPATVYCKRLISLWWDCVKKFDELKSRIAKYSSFLDFGFCYGEDDVHLTKWKSGEEINLSFLSEPSEIETKLIIEKRLVLSQD
jgi:hypothetical protein